MSKLASNNNDKIYVAANIASRTIDGECRITDERDGSRLYPNDLDDKIKIYEREVEEWFLEPARRLLESADIFNNSLIVVMICMSYIEGVEQYKTGVSSKNKSEDFFKLSITRLYPNENFSDEHLKRLYSESRCGLFHNGMVKSGVVFSLEFDKALKFEGQKVKINPKLLLEHIKGDFERYINKLRKVDETIARENFDRIFKVI